MSISRVGLAFVAGVGVTTAVYEFFGRRREVPRGPVAGSQTLGRRRERPTGPVIGSQTPTLEPAECKDGYCEISKGPFAGKKNAFKQTPVTNGEWTAVARGLGEGRFVLLRHDSNTGETRIERRGKTAEELLPEGLRSEAVGIQFDRGKVMIHGSLVLLKMVDNPSAMYDEEGRSFSGLLQPVVGVSYFHAMTWALLKTQEEGGRYKYDLPTDEQQKYVASNAGTCIYGTEACTSLFKDGRKLVHIDEYNGGKGTTVAVNDPRYQQRRPFGVDTTGNVQRWMRFNPAETWKYGLHGGSWGRGVDYGLYSIRGSDAPVNGSSLVGFSVVRQDSK